MAKLDIDSMNEEELEAFIASASDGGAQVGEHETSGGAPRELSLVMILTGLLGMFASANLILGQIRIAEGTVEAGGLSCDINSLFACSSFLGSNVNTLFFNIPNALYGLAFFSGIVGVGLAFLAGARVRRWMWWALSLAMVLALAWIVWFVATAVFVERLLCLYCLITWVATIPLVVHVLARAAQAGHLGMSADLRAWIGRWRWGIVVAGYLVVAAVVVGGLWDKINL